MQTQLQPQFQIINLYLLHEKQRFRKSEAVFPHHKSPVTAICKGLSVHQGDASTEYSYVWEDTLILKFPSYN